MVESGRVTGKARIRASIEKLFVRVQENGSIFVYRKNGRFRVRTEKRWIPCEYRKTVGASTGKGFNQCLYREMVASGSLPKKGRIRASIEKLLG